MIRISVFSEDFALFISLLQVCLFALEEEKELPEEKEGWELSKLLSPTRKTSLLLFSIYIFLVFGSHDTLPLWTWRWKSSQRRRINLDKWEKKIIDPRWFSCTIYWHDHCHDLHHHHDINYNHQVDDVFLVVFPIMFLVLNLIYSNIILNIWLNKCNSIYF